MTEFRYLVEPSSLPGHYAEITEPRGAQTLLQMQFMSDEQLAAVGVTAVLPAPVPAGLVSRAHRFVELPDGGVVQVHEHFEDMF